MTLKKPDLSKIDRKKKEGILENCTSCRSLECYCGEEDREKWEREKNRLRKFTVHPPSDTA